MENIIKNEGFKQIAKAINYATVKAGQIKIETSEEKKYSKDNFEFKRFYGLAQRLGSRTSSRDDFINELSTFLTEYKSEYIRLESKLGQGEIMMLSNVKSSHIDDFIKLIDEWNNISLIANLLLAYGHSDWGRQSN